MKLKKLAKKLAAEKDKKTNDKKSKKYVEEEETDPSKYFDNRVKALNQLAESNSNFNAYPHKFHASMSIPNFIELYNTMENGTQNKEVIVSLAGRIMRRQPKSHKLFFLFIHADGKKVQVFADVSKDPNNFDIHFFHLRRGDIIGVRGYPGKTKRGELSIFPIVGENGEPSVTLLSPCLHMLPAKPIPGKETTLTNPEIRYRQRYLDLIFNKHVREIFYTRSKIIKLYT